MAGSIETTLPQRDEARVEQHVPKILILYHPRFNIHYHSTDTRKKEKKNRKQSTFSYASRAMRE
jgi:hypothetical protein